jgi:acyl-CoA thioesterase FadM
MLGNRGEPDHDADSAPPNGRVDPVSPGGSRLGWDYQVRVSDLNPGGHLDNLHILRVADEARFRLLGRRDPFTGVLVLSGGLDAMPAEVHSLVAGLRADFLRELHFAGDPLWVTTWVCRLGRCSFDLAAEVHQSAQEPPAARLLTTLVLVDSNTATPWPLDEDVRSGLAAYLGDPPQLRTVG